ncbi:protease Lon-related BREX system protein BrxL [bacterium]|nr:protease Lon-related BREX system protein BrxL [bacterium]
MLSNQSVPDALDAKVSKTFAGKVVRKELVRKLKFGSTVPVYVLEYLLGKYCATDDPVAVEAGLKIVNSTLAENFVRPDEANKAQSVVKEKGRHILIDKVKVRYLAEDDKYWAEIVNFGNRFIHVPDRFVRNFDRLLVDGVWSEVELRHEYDDQVQGRRSPFWIDDLKPIQVATFDIQEYFNGREGFTSEEWVDLLVRTIGLEPIGMSRRLKLLYLMRLVPLCEQNYNLIELGPRETGKSFAYQQLSPYAILLTGPTTVANLFYNMSTNKIGLVGLWDAVAFDEVADLQKMPREVITTLKTYCESGSFARGKEQLSGTASVAFFGNIHQAVDVMVRSSHLFAPLPDVIREDTAFLDRIHFYVPGWEIPKMQTSMFTSGYGFVVDYLAEALRELRRRNFTEIIDTHFSLGSQLKSRDVKASRKTVAGLAKLIYPHGEMTKDELQEILELALEGRRRVKEQLKKMGSFEFFNTSFSYIEKETGEERYVGVPEEGGRNLISADPLAPGSLYTASVDDQGKVGLFRLEVGCSSGTGKLSLSGAIDPGMRESLRRAFSYIQGHKVDMGIAQQVDTTDFHVEVIDLLHNHVTGETGVALVVSIYSALKKSSTLPALMVLGDLSIQGNIKALRSLDQALQLGKENGARRAMVPIENKRDFLAVPADIMERVDPIFYSDPMTAALKSLGLT